MNKTSYNKNGHILVAPFYTSFVPVRVNDFHHSGQLGRVETGEAKEERWGFEQFMEGVLSEGR